MLMNDSVSTINDINTQVSWVQSCSHGIKISRIKFLPMRTGDELGKNFHVYIYSIIIPLLIYYYTLDGVHSIGSSNRCILMLNRFADSVM